MKSAHVEIIFCDPAPYQRFPFRAEFEVASDEQIGEYMRGLAEAEGLKNYQVVIDGEVYIKRRVYLDESGEWTLTRALKS